MPGCFVAKSMPIFGGPRMMEDARRQGVGSLKTLVIEMPFSKALVPMKSMVENRKNLSLFRNDQWY